MESVADIACALRERVALPARTRYRLVGVGLAGFVERDSLAAQPELFGG
jgi:DNA polymerase-4